MKAHSRLPSLLLWVVLGGAGQLACWTFPNHTRQEISPPDGGTAGGVDAGKDVHETVCTATAVAAGESHACARMSDGTVWCWGDGQDGQLGNEDFDMRTASSPVLVEKALYGSAGYASVSAGLRTTCASTEEGYVDCWGNNDYYVLGESVGGSRESTPRRNAALQPLVAAVSVADHHACVLAEDGTVWCWGKNNNGQLGDGTRTTNPDAVLVAGLNYVAQLSVGWEHTCAVKTDGTLWCWGDNSQSALGVPAVSSSPIPVQVALLGSDVAQVGTGCGNTCAVKTDGTLWCWGNNGNFALGIDSGSAVVVGGEASGDGSVGLDGGEANRTIAAPTEVPGLAAKVVEVEPGCGSTCVRLADGSARCWGRDITTGVVWRAPTEVPGLGGSVAAISVGVYLACALKTDGSVHCWSSFESVADVSLCH